jgi:hypothetical protein
MSLWLGWQRLSFAHDLVVLRRVDILMPIIGHLGVGPRDPLVRCRKVGIGELGREIRGGGLVLFIVRPVELRRGGKKGESGGRGMSDQFRTSRSNEMTETKTMTMTHRLDPLGTFRSVLLVLLTAGCSLCESRLTSGLARVISLVLLST